MSDERPHNQRPIPPLATRKSSTLADALDNALRSVQLRPEDAAVVALARRYALQVDDDEITLPKIGPLLLAVCIELGMTPKARAAVVKGGARSDGAAQSTLDELRERRAARVDRAPTVDPPAS